MLLDGYPILQGTLYRIQKEMRVASNTFSICILVKKKYLKTYFEKIINASQKYVIVFRIPH